MKNMTKHDALVYALNTVIQYNDDLEVREVLTTMIAQLSKPRKSSDEAKTKAKAKRADARAALMDQVLPIIRMGVADGGTAKEIFKRCAGALPADFTVNKVQYILLNEMADEVVKTEQKGKPNIYTMKG